MNKWAPIHKVTAAGVAGVILWLAQWAIPSWRNAVPLEAQAVIPMAGGVIAAYMTKLEDRFIH